MNSQKIANQPVPELVLKISIPIMISMLIQALYNIVDSKFVSMIDEKAFTAVSIAFPIQNLMISLAIGAAVGSNSLLSRSLGEKNKELTSKVALNSLFLCVVHSIIFLIFGLALSRQYFESQTTDLTIIKYGVDYITVITGVSIFVFIQIMTERLLQATGKTLFTMLSQGIGAIINIILDPILIFGLFSFPAMGVKGAAIATVTGQGVGATIAILSNHFYNREVEFNFSKPDFETIKKIYDVGLPSFALMSITSVAVYFLNKILNQFSDSAVAILGAYFKLQSFIFMPLFGLTNGMVSTLAYNYGAANKERCMEIIRFCMKVGIIICTIGFLIFQIFPAQLISFFNPSQEMYEQGIPALRIVSTCFILAAYNIVAGSTFQALGNGMISFCSSLVRQIVALVPAAYFLSLLGRIEYVWSSYLIAEIINFIYSRYFIKNYTYKKINERAITIKG
ncbi:MAG: MATE family efflux transporter [Peptoniphilus sp.]|uniref:MATE family efflux transporter n=1 Tax=Peptoniphilus sp. TaxID=1971214 RepID=UPI002A74ADAE|nr:MATE family efflux transporter [Peptoniphilus sp.]MDY2987778.1 MATE family efflux transporter [Peptoniphilus sp.]